MSAPHTDPEKEARRHRGPLIGMAAVVLFGVVLIVYWIFEEVATSDPPEPPRAEDRLDPPSETIVPKPGATTAP